MHFFISLDHTPFSQHGHEDFATPFRYLLRAAFTPRRFLLPISQPPKSATILRFAIDIAYGFSSSMLFSRLLF